ncbi:MAG: queuosine salvage family protein [Proteobacteria bacterium]|nr:queuosine salvage family protein [Pseudomonadota bacterium]
MATLFDEIRGAAAEVASRARSVRLSGPALDALAVSLAEDASVSAPADPARLRLCDPATTLAYVVTLDALNFGSGYFPYLAKRDGRSGYFTVALSLREQFEREGPFNAQSLQKISPADCARLLHQDSAIPEVAELMGLFSQALQDLGRFLIDRHGGRFERLVESAGARAEHLVRELARMPLYRDEERYDGLRVPFYKRAQITAADLAEAFDSEGWGAFEDLTELTLFADNLVPHVLRRLGVLEYAPELAAHVDSGRLLPLGTPEEIEIRAVALHAVERLVRAVSERGRQTTAARIDSTLWNRGQSPELKATPRHRTRCTFY